MRTYKWKLRTVVCAYPHVTIDRYVFVQKYSASTYNSTHPRYILTARTSESRYIVTTLLIKVRTREMRKDLAFLLSFFLSIFLSQDVDDINVGKHERSSIIFSLCRLQTFSCERHVRVVSICEIATKNVLGRQCAYDSFLMSSKKSTWKHVKKDEETMPKDLAQFAFENKDKNRLTCNVYVCSV